jgi:hypothetical protein
MGNEKPPEPGPDEPTDKLPYEPPAVISDEVFETLALGCNKVSHRPSCQALRKS